MSGVLLRGEEAGRGFLGGQDALNQICSGICVLVCFRLFPFK